LKYGQVVYSDETISGEKSQILDDVCVSAAVQNNSDYAIDESVQVYVKYEDADELAPGFQLMGMESISLQPGESKTVNITLPARAFASITDDGKCVVKPGTYTVTIGGQQPDDRSKELTNVEVACFKVVKEGNETEVEY